TWGGGGGGRSVRDAGIGGASGILVTGQQPVLSVSLLITSISAARGEGKAASWATRRTDPATAGPAGAPPGPVPGERRPASRRLPAGCGVPITNGSRCPTRRWAFWPRR